MTGHSRPKDSVLSHAYVAAIHVFDVAAPWSRGCPTQGRAWRGETGDFVTGSSAPHQAGQPDPAQIATRRGL